MKRPSGWHKLPFKAKRLCEKVEKEKLYEPKNESEKYWLKVMAEKGFVKETFGSWSGTKYYAPIV